MQHKIDKVHIADFHYDHFISKYWQSEVPLIIQGVSLPTKEIVDKNAVKEFFQKEENKQVGWYDSEIKYDLTPIILQDILKKKDISMRKKPMRVFMQPHNHTTFMHYDGNSVHGFNFQHQGKKVWHIVSPNTPFPLIPFMYVVIRKEITKIPNNIKYYKFTLGEGDLLFLPRYWQHQVKSLDTININFNWVMTPLLPNNTKIGKRECEIIKLRETLPIINKAFFPEPIGEYGGTGKKLTSAYIKDVSLWKSVRRLLIELRSYIRLIYMYKHLRQQADIFVNNNFNVK